MNNKNSYYILSCILLQELFDETGNDIDCDYLREKYTLTPKVLKTLKNLINLYFGED